MRFVNHYILFYFTHTQLFGISKLRKGPDCYFLVRERTKISFDQTLSWLASQPVITAISCLLQKQMENRLHMPYLTHSLPKQALKTL